MRLRTRAIDHGVSGPHLLITGGVHGDEFEGPLAIQRLSERPELASLRGKLTLIPVVNENAFARGQRVAEDGLDLARTCPGRRDGSITEKTAFALKDVIRTADFYIDLHTGGTAFTVWPLTGYMLHPSADVLEKQRAMARAFNLPVIWGTDYRLEGRSLSIARDANIPAIYAEYEGGGRCSLRGIDSYLEGCLNVMAQLGMIDREIMPSAVELIVEDPRPQSGHMQSSYPSPAKGCFLPAAELGATIRVGQPLGSVIEPFSGEKHEVLAGAVGRVLVLRTFPAVQKGDGLAVILELDQPQV